MPADQATARYRSAGTARQATQEGLPRVLEQEMLGKLNHEVAMDTHTGRLTLGPGASRANRAIGGAPLLGSQPDPQTTRASITQGHGALQAAQGIAVIGPGHAEDRHMRSRARARLQDASVLSKQRCQRCSGHVR